MALKNPNIDIYWEDFHPQTVFNFGSFLLTKENIIAFGLDYDPLPHHICEQTARQSPIGTLCASGIQGVGIAHKILCDNLLRKSSLVAGRGFEEMIVHRPILPEQQLTISMEVLNCKAHSFKNDRGWVNYKVKLIAEDQRKLLSYKADVLFLKRPV